jgi:hypothetical protein
MTFFTIDDKALKEKIISFLGRKPVYSNYYGVDLKDVQYFEDSETLILLKPFETFNRIYFLSMDALLLINHLKVLGQHDIINIPSKKNIDESLYNVLKHSGYHICGIYERWYNNSNPSKEEFNGIFASINDIKTIYDIIYSVFNPFLDHLPSLQKLREMILNQQVLVNKDEKDNVQGVFIFTLENTKCYFNCWVDKVGGGAGLLLLFNMFNYMKIRNIEKSYLWINSGNTIVKKIHQLFGAKPDGLKDYTFIKQ